MDIVIVNWDSDLQLKNCLYSILKAVHEGHLRVNIIVVDNASADGSVDDIEEIPLSVKVTRNTENRGFGAACNQGAKNNFSKYILFLNPDTIVSAEAFSIPLEFLEHSENAHYAVCSIQLRDEKGQISRSCARFPNLKTFFSGIIGLTGLLPNLSIGHKMTGWDHLHSKDVDHVIGAFYLVRRSVFETLGGFDERFFVYLEDVDLSYRIHQAGGSIRYMTEAYAFHKGGGASGQAKDIRLFYSLQSKILYGFKHLSLISGFALLLGTIVVEPCSRILQAFLLGSVSQIKYTLRGYRMLYRALPVILQKSQQKQIHENSDVYPA
nr:glycosyltransferase family 2 protein [Bacteroidota bacterium]